MHLSVRVACLVLAVVTDLETGRALAPDEAVYVSGSDVALDARSEALRTSHHEVADRHWHRCLPSVLSFATAEGAAGFQVRHGGVVLRPEELGFAAVED